MSALVIGPFSPEQSEAIELALSRADMEARLVEDAEEAREELRREPPALALIDGSGVALEPLMRWVRGRADLMGMIAIATVPSPTDSAFCEAVAAGCDDVVVLGDLGAVTRRAARLAHYDPTARPRVDQGCAIVAHPEDHARRALGRSLRLAGFEVRFAKDNEEVPEVTASGATPELLVASESLPAGALRAVIDVRQGASGAPVPAVIVGTRRQLRELGAEALKRTATLLEGAPPDHLLFTANELLRPGIKDMRASARVLWDAMCAFRPSGQLHPVLGLTYNLSADGLYVRSLDPPERGTTLWFELRPPERREAVHLRGEVVWVKPLGIGPGGSAPPGFGVRIDEMACPRADLAAYREAYAGQLEPARKVA